MYSSVWNRVALLAAGMALGWNLVNYWAVADAAKRSQRINVILGGGGGLIVLIALAFSSPAAAIAGVLIFALSALVAYAGNARHISNVPEPLPLLQPKRSLERDPRVGVLLVHAGEPAAYDGPLPWALRCDVREAQGLPVPRWFTRPRMYDRIRATYGAMPPASSLNGALQSLVEALSQHLSAGYVVERGYLAAEPSVIYQLTAWAKAGLSQAIILPLALSERDAELLRSEITRSRAREVGLAVTVLDPISLDGQLPDTYGERFAMLCRGETPPAIPFTPDAWTEDLAGKIMAVSG